MHVTALSSMARQHSLAQLAHKAAQQRLLPLQLFAGQPRLPPLAIGQLHDHLHEKKAAGRWERSGCKAACCKASPLPP